MHCTVTFLFWMLLGNAFLDRNLFSDARHDIIFISCRSKYHYFLFLLARHHILTCITCGQRPLIESSTISSLYTFKQQHHYQHAYISESELFVGFLFLLWFTSCLKFHCLASALNHQFFYSYQPYFPSIDFFHFFFFLLAI